MESDPPSPALRRSNRMVVLPKRFKGTTAQPPESDLPSEPRRSASSTSNRNMKRHMSTQSASHSASESSTTEPHNQSDKMPRVNRKHKSLRREQEPDPGHLATERVNGDASTGKATIRKAGRKKSDAKRTATTKKTTKKQKGKGKEKLAKKSEEVAYIAGVVEYRKQIYDNLGQSRPMEPSTMETSTTTPSTSGSSTTASSTTQHTEVVGKFPLLPPWVTKRTGIAPTYTANLDEFEVWDNDFETSEEESEPEPEPAPAAAPAPAPAAAPELEPEPPLTPQEPSIYLADLNLTLAATIYRNFALHCMEYFEETWLCEVDRLLWIDARDYRWVENMRRKHAGLRTYELPSKQEARWIYDMAYVEEEIIRSKAPKPEDYDWMLAEFPQEEVMSYQDMKLAKKYANQRGIPWEKVLNFVEEEDDDEEEEEAEEGPEVIDSVE